jgi:bifunctional DNA-binding transcriptional regulator/antitoxin component of YhaV-PrlF toxin-antitoxin module
MTVKVDSKRRVVVPGVKPGDVFACEQQDENHILLVRLALPPAPAKKTRAEVRRAIKNSRMKFDLTWDELRAITREP